VALDMIFPAHHGRLTLPLLAMKRRAVARAVEPLTFDRLARDQGVRTMQAWPLLGCSHETLFDALTDDVFEAAPLCLWRDDRSGVVTLFEEATPSHHRSPSSRQLALDEADVGGEVLDVAADGQVSVV